ncbi:MAG: CHASE4 domain-containing protein, partial [Alphaproteobacteria bacterium]
MAVLALSARWQDNAYRQGLGQALRGAMAMHEDTLGKLVRDYALWDETVAYAAERDPVWPDDNIGAYVQRSFGLSLSLLLDPDNEPIYTAANEKRVDPGAYASMIVQLAPLVEAVRASPMDAAPPRLAYVRAGDAIYLVAAAPVTPEKATPESMVRRARPVLIFARVLNRGWLDRLATVLPMSSLDILDADPGGPLTAALRDPSGATAGWLTAMSVEPVGAAIEEIAPILAILFSIMVGL